MVGNFAWNASRSLFVPPVEIVNIERENKTRLDTVFPFHWKSQLSARERLLVADEKLDFSVDRYRFECTNVPNFDRTKASNSKRHDCRKNSYNFRNQEGKEWRKIGTKLVTTAFAIRILSFYKTIPIKAFFQSGTNCISV